MTITVGDLIEQLQLYPAGAELRFSNGLNFYRLKMRGPNLVQVEFNENVYRTESGEWIIEGDSAALPE